MIKHREDGQLLEQAYTTVTENQHAKLDEAVNEFEAFAVTLWNL